jgi:hypothetical protein
MAGFKKSIAQVDTEILALLGKKQVSRRLFDVFAGADATHSQMDSVGRGLQVG